MATRPFLTELKRFFPQAHTTLATTDHYTYAVPEDLVDAVFIQDTSLSLLAQYRANAALGSFDLLFDLADTGRSRVLTKLARARLKLGFPYRSCYNHWLYDITLPRSNYYYEGEVMLDFLKLFGCQPRYPLDFALPTHSPGSAQREILYFPFASNQGKSLPLAAWRTLLAQAAAAYPDHRHVVLEGQRPSEQISLLDDLLPRHANLQVQKAQGLETLTQRVAAAALLVSGDTGVRNLALATHTPSVGIFFSTLPYRYWPRYGDLHDCVFNPEGTHPDAKEILCAMGRSLRRHYPEAKAAPTPQSEDMAG